MEVTLTDDQEFFRDTTRRFLATECPLTTVRDLAHVPDGFDRAYWRQGAELGWTSLLVPEELGGGSISGNGVVDLTIVADAFGRHVAPGPLLPTNVVAAAIARSGHPDQQALLEAFVSGETIAAWCGAEHAWARAGPPLPRRRRRAPTSSSPGPPRPWRPPARPITSS